MNELHEIVNIDWASSTGALWKMYEENKKCSNSTDDGSFCFICLYHLKVSYVCEHKCYLKKMDPIFISFLFSSARRKYFKMIRNALGAWFPARWFILRIIFSSGELLRLIRRKVKKCWLLAAARLLLAWLPRCLCDTKEKYFIHLTRGSPCLAAATAWWPQTRLRVAEAPGNSETHGALCMKDLSIFTA